jgi:hypothetical protein
LVRRESEHGAKVETKITTHMGYLQEVDRWLDMLFTDLADEKISYDEVKRDIRSRILESYRNGLKGAGQSPAARDRERPPAPHRRERFER